MPKQCAGAIDENDTASAFAPIYDVEDSIEKKFETIAKKIYHAGSVSYAPAAVKAIRDIEALGLDKLPVCVAKTQYSLSDDPKLLGAPEGFTITVKDVRVSAGARFIVVYTGADYDNAGASEVSGGSAH